MRESDREGSHRLERPRECLAARVAGHIAELILDPQQLVVLGRALATGRSAGLDLSGVGRDRDVGDGRVLGLAGTVRDHRCEVGTLGDPDALEGLAQASRSGSA